MTLLGLHMLLNFVKRRVYHFTMLSELLDWFSTFMQARLDSI